MKRNKTNCRHAKQICRGINLWCPDCGAIKDFYSVPKSRWLYPTGIDDVEPAAGEGEGELMPSIDYTGRWFVKAYETSLGLRPGHRAAIRFPVEASRQSAASRFAEKMILQMLPGWDRGTIFLSRDGKTVAIWDLYRKAKGK